MKITLDFTKAKPTAKQIEFACEIHKHIRDGVSDKDFAKICSNSVRMCKYLTEHKDAYRSWWLKQNHWYAELQYARLLDFLGIPMDIGF